MLPDTFSARRVRPPVVHSTYADALVRMLSVCTGCTCSGISQAGISRKEFSVTPSHFTRSLETLDKTGNKGTRRPSRSTSTIDVGDAPRLEAMGCAIGKTDSETGTLPRYLGAHEL